MVSLHMPVRNVGKWFCVENAFLRKQHHRLEWGGDQLLHWQVLTVCKETQWRRTWEKESRQGRSVEGYLDCSLRKDCPRVTSFGGLDCELCKSEESQLTTSSKRAAWGHLFLFAQLLMWCVD